MISIIAQAAEKYLEMLDVKRDLGAIRLAMIDYVLKLLDVGSHPKPAR
jgi:hypothetical protein